VFITQDAIAVFITQDAIAVFINTPACSHLPLLLKRLR
jgi:hypothetical protein